MGSTGKVERIVSVVALCITDMDGLVFVHLGNRGDTAKCQLPGMKICRSEEASDAVQRLFDNRLLPLVGHTEIERSERHITESVSKEWGVRTRYLRTVSFARLLEPIALPVCGQRVSKDGTGSVRVTGRS